MYTVIYYFKVKKNQIEVFKDAWRELTLLLIKNNGSKGSRLHTNADLEFIAYAQWPNKETLDKSKAELSGDALIIKKRLHDSCEESKIIYEMEVVEDCLGNFH